MKLFQTQELDTPKKMGENPLLFFSSSSFQEQIVFLR